MHYRKQNLFIFCVAASLGLSARAGEPHKESGGAHRMDLKECMAYAVAHSTKMRIAEADRSDERITRRDAVLALFTPAVSGGVYAWYRDGRNLDPETNTYTNTLSFNNYFAIDASYTQFDGFSAVNNLKIARTAVQMGLSAEQQTRDEVCLATMEAYYNLVYYTRLAEAVENEVEAARTALARVRRQEELGQKGYADVVQLEADLAEREYQLVNTRNLATDAELTLRSVMFWPLEEPLDIDTSITEVLPEGERDIETVLDHARLSNPALIQARGERDNARRELNTARWQLLPTLGLSAGWSTSYYTYPGRTDVTVPAYRVQFNGNMGEYVQVSLNIPIFDRLNGHSKMVRKRNALRRASAELDARQQQVEGEVVRAVRDRDGAESAYYQADKLASVQAQAYALNSRKFEQGLISAIEYQTAAGKYLEAQASRLDALLKFYLKSAVVRYYDGEPYLEQ